jgi:pilus assembly protein Flp/PilA
MPMSRDRNVPSCGPDGGLGGIAYSEEGGAELLRMGLFYAGSKRRIGSEEGATAVEYALMIALIALVIVLAVTFLGTSTNSVFDNPELKTALT